MKRETFTANEPAWLAALVPPIVALTVYALLAYPLRAWLVDDAAISMAYAANWTAGHGLVAQPGLEPIEGYSNFLWVVLLGGLDLAGSMSVAGVKALSMIFVALSLLSLDRTARQVVMSGAARLSVLLLTATSASIVAWTASGLENPLTLFLACELLRVAFQIPTLRRAIHFGGLVGALAMTRPEGIAFALFPALFLYRQPRLLLTYGTTVAVIFGAFLAFRYATFGDLLPNTFYAKAAGFELKAVAKNAGQLLSSPFGIGPVAVVVLASVYRLKDRRVLVPLGFMAIAAALFIAMPTDWMPYERFATPFLPAIFLFAGMALQRWTWALAALVALSLGMNAYRLVAFYGRPTVPVGQVAAVSERFEAHSKALGLEKASLLTPDIGGLLLTSPLRIYDLAGLTDRKAARTLYADPAAFRAYIFDEARPTFIHVHGLWATYARFDDDPRFRRDYEPINERLDPWLLRQRNIRMITGDYVRKEARRASR